MCIWKGSEDCLPFRTQFFDKSLSSETSVLVHICLSDLIWSLTLMNVVILVYLFLISTYIKNKID